MSGANGCAEEIPGVAAVISRSVWRSVGAVFDEHPRQPSGWDLCRQFDRGDEEDEGQSNETADRQVCPYAFRCGRKRGKRRFAHYSLETGLEPPQPEVVREMLTRAEA